MKAAVCAIVKNEGPIIGEWLGYHFALGFDAAVVLDNGSTDGTAQVVEAAARDFDVRSASVRDNGPATQTEAYVAACRAFGAEFDWMAFVDADEFVTPTLDASVKDLLVLFDAHRAVCLNWLMFGSAGHFTRPDDLVIEAFRTCAPASFGPEDTSNPSSGPAPSGGRSIPTSSWSTTATWTRLAGRSRGVSFQA